MPIQKISGGFRYGKTGKVYRGIGARTKAIKQGVAIKISQAKAKAHSIKVKASSRARGYERRV